MPQMPLAMLQPPPMTPPPMTGPMKIQAALTLLKSEKARGYRIDIEDESTVVADEQQDKQARIEFLTALGGFLKEAVPAGQQSPALVPLLGKMLSFGARSFRAGRDLEQTLEDTVAKLESQAKKAETAPPPPNPELIKAQAVAQDMQVKAQAEAQRMQMEAQTQQAANQVELQKMAAQEKIDERQSVLDQGDQELRRLEIAMKMREMDLKQQEIDLDHQREAREAERARFDMSITSRDSERADRDVQAKEQNGSDLQSMKAEFEKLKQAHAAPKVYPKVRIVRDPQTNRAVGLEPVAEPQPTIN